MTPTRREFIQSLGVTLASLALARCAPTPEVVVECYIIETVQVERPKATPTVGEKALMRQRVRDCWLRLDWLAEQSRSGADAAKHARQELTTEHRAVLDELVTFEKMNKDVAHYVQLAYVSAVNHIVASNPPIDMAVDVVECYEILVPEIGSTPTPTPSAKEAAHRFASDYSFEGGQRLVQQADLLTELAATSDIEADTIARAQSAVQRDMMLLSPTGRQELAARLVEAARGNNDFPPVEELDLDVPPEATEAARFLVELLLEE